MANSEDPTLSSDELCSLTGLTQRRHQQLAKAGFFPPPVDGRYERDITIRGVFRYYRESRHGREDLVSKKLEQEIRKLQIMNDQKEGDLIVFSDVEQMLFRIAAKAKTQARKITLELPAKLIGLDRPEVEQKVGEELSGLFATLSGVAGDLVALKADAAQAANEERDEESADGPPGGEGAHGVDAGRPAAPGGVDRAALSSRGKRRGL